MTWAEPNSGTNRVCSDPCVTVPEQEPLLLSTEGEGGAQGWLGGSQGPWQESIFFGESLGPPQATAQREGFTPALEGFVRYSEALLRQAETY